jgi:ATP-dependent helicase YprA (DUF1998 family)
MVWRRTGAQCRYARYHPHPKFLPYPAKHVSIRGAEEDKYTLVNITKDAPKILEEVEFSRALFEVYEGGVVWSSHLVLTLLLIYAV